MIVVSGPGGAGKGTLVSRLVADDPHVWLSRSWTTRARRPGEAEDAYHFATPSEFRAHAEAGGFLEWVDFLDYQQGTPLPDPPAGADVLFEIDVKGAAEIKRRFPDALLVFVDTPDRDEQERRLRGRGDPEEKVLQRLAKADEERALAGELGAVVLVNDDLDEAYDRLRTLLDGARART